MKKCPLMIGKVSIPECQKEHCAWWDEKNKCCAVVVKQPKKKGN